MLANITILATDLLQMAHVIKKEDVGLLVDKKCDPEEIADKLAFLQLHQNRMKFIENAKKAAPNYGYESQREIQKLFE